MLYPQYFIDDLKTRADLVRIIQPYAQDLKKKGANWMACCPFHQEKTPSFSVNPSKGFYKCFGCGKGGTAFNFLMEMEGLNFPEAVKRVAEMSGVMLPEPVDDASYQRSKKQRAEKKQLADQIIELNQVATDFWQAELGKKNAKATAAREYLAGRGISQDIQTTFRIGYSPDKWDSLLTVLRDFGADDKLIEQSGLVSLNEEKKRLYDRFRGRIMFPVLDVNGRPVAFGARAIDPDDQPKYLNSPETAAYIKGEHLYGLFQGKDEIRKKFAILVEGYLDLIALAEFGIKNTVASLGTALTPEQARLLARFTKKVVINYDGDDAGVKAARRAIEHLLPQDFDVKVLVLPDGKDPDEFVRANGADAYHTQRGNAATYLRFSLDTAVKGRNLHNARQKAEAVEEFLPVISAIRNNVQRRESFDQAMTFFQIDDSGLKRELWNALKNAGPGVAPAAARRVRSAHTRVTVAERRLLELMLVSPDVLNTVFPLLEPTDYENLATAEVFEAVGATRQEGSGPTPESLMPHVMDDELLIDLLKNLSRDPVPPDAALAEAENCVFSLRDMAIANRIAEINREAATAEAAGRAEEAGKLVHQQLELEKMRREIRHRVAGV
jgi:DNA primase